MNNIKYVIKKHKAVNDVDINIYLSDSKYYRYSWESNILDAYLFTSKQNAQYYIDDEDDPDIKYAEIVEVSGVENIYIHDNEVKLNLIKEILTEVNSGKDAKDALEEFKKDLELYI